MRVALANLIALIVYVAVLWFCFAFILGFALNDKAPLGFTYQLNKESFGFAMIYMMFMGPGALILMLIYFALFRARAWAIWLLAAAAVIISCPIFGFPDISAEASIRLWTMIVWAGVVATLAHHLVFALLRPRKILEAETQNG